MRPVVLGYLFFAVQGAALGHRFLVVGSEGVGDVRRKQLLVGQAQHVGLGHVKYLLVAPVDQQVAPGQVL